MPLLPSWHDSYFAWAWIFYMFVGVRRTSKYDPKELQKRPLYKAIITFKSTKKLTVNHQHTFCFCCPFPKSNKNLKHKFFIIFYPRGPSPPLFGLPFNRHDKRVTRALRPHHPHGTKGLGCTKESQHGDITRSGGAIGQGCLRGFQGKVGAHKTWARSTGGLFQNPLSLQMNRWMEIGRLLELYMLYF